MKGQSFPDTRQASSVYGTQTIQRAALLLRLLSDYNRTGLRLTDLAAMSHMERPTVHRILQGLIDERLVAQEKVTNKYFLGAATYEMGLAASHRYRLRDICQSHLQSIVEKTGATVLLTVRSGFDGVCIDRKDGTSQVKIFALDIGQHRPLGVGSGSLAILSALPDGMVDRILAINDQRHAYDNESFTFKELRQRIARAREMGYVEKSLKEISGISAIGISIPDTEKEPIGAISLWDLTSRIGGERKDQVLSILRSTALEIGSIVNGKQAANLDQRTHSPS